MKLLLLLIPPIGAAAGWAIISILIKIIFWPPEPTKILFTNRLFQGLLPHKRIELAKGIGEIIETNLLSAVTAEAGVAPEIIDNLTDTAVKAARERLDKKIPALVPKGIKHRIAGVVEDIIRREIPAFVDTLADNMRCDRDGGADLCRWAEEKIQDYDLSQLETTITGAKETFYLKAGAAAIGFASGLLQLLIAALVINNLHP